VVVIDNSGTDGTPEFVRGVGDERVRYILNEKNIGMIGSINKGITLMDDDIEWCTILSDDDLLDERYVAASLEAVKRHSSRAIVNSNRIFINWKGKRIRKARTVARDQDAFEYLECRLKKRTETYLTGIFFSRRGFDEIGGYPLFSTGMASDDALIFSLSLKDRLVHCGEAKAFIRFHEGAESQALSDILRILDTIAEFRRHCEKKVLDLGPSGERNIERFRTVLDKYVEAMNSGCWLKHLHDVLFPRAVETVAEESNARKIAVLCSIVEAGKFRFTSRVNLDCRCFRKFGVCPESSLGYRLFWDLVTDFSVMDHVRRYLRTD
jgi:hypothetical protein